MFSIGRIKKFDQVFDKSKRRQPAVRHFIHAGNEFAPPSCRCFMRFQFFGQFHRAARVIDIQIDAQQ